MPDIDQLYKQKTYEELSKEFKELYPLAVRAFELIPLMYNRLTLVDGLTHKEAMTKIRNDHKHLSGFTARNIYRYLPSDNPKTPRRVMTSRHNNSVTEGNDSKNFNLPKHEEDVVVALNDNDDPSLIGERIDEQHNDSYSFDKERGSSIEFECSLSFENLRLYMHSIFNETGVHGIVWIHGTLDLRTGKVTYVSTGRIITDVSYNSQGAS